MNTSCEDGSRSELNPLSMEFVTRNLPLCHEKSWNNWILHIYQIYPKKGFLRWIHVKSRLLIDVPFRFAIPNPPQNSGGFKWYTQCLCCPWDAAQNCPSHQRVNQATVFAWEDSRSISRHSDEWVAVLTFSGEPVLSIFCQPFLAHSYRFWKNIPTQNWMFFLFSGMSISFFQNCRNLSGCVSVDLFQSLTCTVGWHFVWTSCHQDQRMMRWSLPTEVPSLGANSMEGVGCFGTGKPWFHRWKPSINQFGWVVFFGGIFNFRWHPNHLRCLLLCGFLELCVKFRPTTKKSSDWIWVPGTPRAPRCFGQTQLQRSVSSRISFPKRPLRKKFKCPWTWMSRTLGRRFLLVAGSFTKRFCLLWKANKYNIVIYIYKHIFHNVYIFMYIDII